MLIRVWITLWLLWRYEFACGVFMVCSRLVKLEVHMSVDRELERLMVYPYLARFDVADSLCVLMY